MMAVRVRAATLAAVRERFTTQHAATMAGLAHDDSCPAALNQGWLCNCGTAEAAHNADYALSEARAILDALAGEG